MKSDRLVFLDTETTSLRADRRVWEIGLIVREDGRDLPAERWLIQREDLDLGNADSKSLEIGGFYTRHPDVTSDYEPTFSESEALRDVERITRGATVVGAVPNFDTEVLATRMRANGLCPSWRYHLVDVETLAAGALRLAPPWDFNQVLKAFGLAYDEAERHTAVGDARMARDLYDAVMRSQAAVPPSSQEEVEARLAAATNWTADHPDQVQAQLVRNLTAAGIVRRDAFTWPQTCPNVSFYGRPCALPPHGWDQSCMFTPDREGEYDLTDGSTLKDLLEALTAGGRVAVSAAMRWHEYRLYSRATEAEQLFGKGHTVAQGRRLAVETAKEEREIVMGYLDRRVAEGVPSRAGAQHEQLIQDEEAVAEGEGES